MKKRLLSWFLAMVMVLGMLPMTAWADPSSENSLQEEIPFSLEIDGLSHTVTRNTTDYEYTFDIYDASYEYIGTEMRSVPQYDVEIPADAEEIILSFEEERLAYGYDEVGGYVTSYGSYGDGTTGKKTAVIDVDTLAAVEFVRVQTPYDDNWKSETLYAIHMIAEERDVAEGKISMNSLLKNISASYVDNSSEWVIMDMAAYEDLNPKGSKSSDTAKQNYINASINSVTADEAGDMDYAKAILVLTAIGVDAEELYTMNSNESISAIEGLNGVNQSSSAWCAPYILAAYNQNAYEGTEDYEDALIEAVLQAQNADGYWTEWGDSIQTTSNMIAGLAFYYDDREDVQIAVDKAVAFLSTVQKEDGSFDAYGSGADANTAAMVVIGLSAVGINPDTDKRFIKNENSALDALLRFALKDNSGFGYQNNVVKDDYATEQGFRALIAAKQMEIKDSFNIYDFSQNTDLIPGYAKEIEEETPSRPSHRDDDITVKVGIKAIDKYWMRNKDVTVDEDATVYEAFMEALDDSDIEQEGAEDGYIKSMTKDGEELGEFDKGENSGWLYEVNDKQPDVGIKNYRLKDGDEILFYYTKDWTEDVDDLSRNEEEKSEEMQEGIVEEEVLEEIRPEVQLPAIEETYTDISTDTFYYEPAQWAVAKGIVSGVTETEFGADWNCSRGQLMTFLWRMMGSPATETQTAPYIDVAKDMYYHDAILWATENDLANGTDGISFSPEMTLNRGQAVTFLWRAAGMPEPAGEIAFADVSESDYYWKAILWAAENGITSGTGEGTFSPEAPCTRGQIVTFLYRYFGK